MGKQVNFYMTQEDEAEFLEFMRSERDVCLIPDTLPTESIACMSYLPKRGETLFWFKVSLWDRNHSPPPKRRHVQEQGYWVVDELNSEVIEFSRSILSEGRLVRGRIWAEMTEWQQTEPPSLVRKSKTFEKWFDKLARWIRQHATRDENGDYVFPGAAQYESDGGRLVQAVFAKSIKRFDHEL